VTELVVPSERYRASYLAAEQELVAIGAAAADEVVTDATFAAKLLRYANYHAGNVPAGRVPETTLWMVDGDEFLGRISIRHVLSDFLRVIGGHIGYDVRPSRRRQGLGHRMLALALPRAKALGIDPALLTCDAANLASRAVIERAGGTLVEEFTYEGIASLRFSLPTSSAAPDR